MIEQLSEVDPSSAAFAGRLRSAFSDHPSAPNGYGQLTWLRRELSNLGVTVSVETVRKWLSGATTPRRDKIAALAEVLRVDTAWLAMGAQPVANETRDLRVVRLKRALLEISEISNQADVLRIIEDALGQNTKTEASERL